MKWSIFMVLLLSVIYSCSNSGNNFSNNNRKGEDLIKQQDDGTISLNLEKAAFYSSDIDPSNNTAEWDFVVSKPGRYSVWLSSATIDTMNLQYANSVKINLLDERLEGKPVGDKIVLNARDVKYPYYRADSYMGSFYIQEPGEYSIQVISEKVMPQNKSVQNSSTMDKTRLMSVILTPMTR
jgi:hypothetical protein